MLTAVITVNWPLQGLQGVYYQKLPEKVVGVPKTPCSPGLMIHKTRHSIQHSQLGFTTMKRYSKSAKRKGISEGKKYPHWWESFYDLCSHSLAKGQFCKQASVQPTVSVSPRLYYQHFLHGNTEHKIMFTIFIKPLF